MDRMPCFSSLFFRQRLNAAVLPMLGGIALFLLLPQGWALALLLLCCAGGLLLIFKREGEERKGKGKRERRKGGGKGERRTGAGNHG